MVRSVASGMSPISAKCHHAMVLKCIRKNVFYPVHAKHLLVTFINYYAEAKSEPSSSQL